jgi:NADH-quinone oxidoreductase subunit C
MTYNTDLITDEVFAQSLNLKLANINLNYNLSTANNEWTLNLPNKNDLITTLEVLKKDPELDFAVLADLCGCDFIAREQRFELNYHLLSITKNKRIRLKVKFTFGEKVESVAFLYSTACWFEREAFDMFGIEFLNAPDHRRILTDYNFVGFPLRKDFPLSGFKEIKYSKTENKIIETDVEMIQEYRDFDFEMPWNGVMQKVKQN